MSIPRLSIPVLLALCLSACATARPDAPPALSGDWRVEDLDGGGVPDRVPFAVTFAEGRVSASAGCNRLVGDFVQSGARLRVGPLASTRMACSPALEEQERRLAASLGAVTTVARAGEGAVILSGPGGARLTLRPADAGEPAPGDLALRCGEEDFQVRFSAAEARVLLPDGSAETLPRLNTQGVDPEAPRVFTNGRMTFTQEIEGGRAVTFSRGRMAPTRCEARRG